MDESGQTITNLLSAARGGDQRATEALYQSVYAHLRTLAHAQRRRWQGNDTIGTTALISEAYLKLSLPTDFANRAHFFATAAKAMRQILVNYAVEQSRLKRGGDQLRVTLQDAQVGTEMTAAEILDLERSMATLERSHPRRARVLECRLFGEMTVAETGQALGISTATVKREWRLGANWLARALADPPLS